jgi:hypothetical protein
MHPPTTIARPVTPDPPPIPPEKPLASDCCESGCDRCVFDIYADELAHYEAELAAWRERNPQAEMPAESHSPGHG